MCRQNIRSDRLASNHLPPGPTQSTSQAIHSTLHFSPQTPPHTSLRLQKPRPPPAAMLLRHRLLPRLLLLPSTHTSTSTLLRPSRFPRRLSLSPRFSALSHLAAAETVDQSDNEGAPHEDVQVKLPLDRLFVPPGATVDAGNQEAVSARVLKGSNIVLGPYARGDAQVVNADFVKSSVRPDDCPRDGRPEFALVGRSNVGKSSLLNSLVRRKRLALTSKKPGRFCFARVICLVRFFL